jgi:hypothetical protein
MINTPNNTAPAQEADLFQDTVGPLNSLGGPNYVAPVAAPPPSAAPALAGPPGEADLFSDVLGPGNSPGGPNYVEPPFAAPQVGPNVEAQRVGAALAKDAANPDLTPMPGDFQASPDALGIGLGLGTIKGVFNTKDFLTTGAGMFGAPPSEQDRSQLRQNVDATSAAFSKADGAGYGFAEGIAETAVGLLGAGKVALLAKAGGLATAGISAIGMAAAFEPHAENFANLAQRIPSLNGPLTAFFASDPSDSAIAGYAKNALTSLGFEAATIGLFTGAMVSLRALRGGDDAAIEAAHAELDAALQAHVESIGQARTPEPSPATLASSQPTTTMAMESHQSGDATISGPAFPQDVGQAAEAATTANSQLKGEQPRAVVFTFDDGSINRLIETSANDTLALIKHGSWDAAIAAGHVFGGEDHVPWQKLSGDATDGEASTSLDAFTARVRDAYRDQSDEMKGGDVQTDAMNDTSVNQRVTLWNQDPGALLGALQEAGERAGSLHADMDASFAVAQRVMQDAWAMASRIKAGDFSDGAGSLEAAYAALKATTQVAATAFGSANSILSNSARALRGARSEFALSPMQIAKMQSLDGDALASILAGTQGDPRALAKVMQPGIISRLVDGAHFFMINNLISSPLTHAVIAASNTWQLLARPAMRMAGAAYLGTSDSVGTVAAKEYGYIATSIPDAFRSAVEAFKAGDSIISPHALNVPTGGVGAGAQGGTSIGQQIAQMQFKPMANVSDVLSNVLTAGLKTGAFPSRFVGFQDEFVKQIAYRSKVSAQAFVEGSSGYGLEGADLTRYVQDELFAAFDEYGRATNTAALNEAKVATYQNDLNPTGSFGWATAGAKVQGATTNFPLAKLILPFVKTPANLFRQGVQLTPGLNLLQKEFRDAIANGADPAAQALAVGQMGMGALLMGTAATLAYQGLITGDAPSDPKLASEAMADGWRPNSIVIAHKDGTKTYVPFDRYDPIMMPLALAANIVAVLKQPEVADQNKAQTMLAALSAAMIKQLTDKLYLQSIKNTIDAIQSPDHQAAKVAGGLAGNFVPYSSALHLINADPVMREADTFISAMLAKVPGFSQHFPARRDWAGDPITVHKQGPMARHA